MIPSQTQNFGRVAQSPQDTTPHPLSHIDKLKCYEWMLAECAALNQNRQAREDGLIATILQISSAALLAVPGLFFASESSLPQFSVNPLLYVGTFCFLTALLAALLEQHFSAIAHAKQIEVAHAYYTFQSSEREHPKSRAWVRWTRRTAYGLFVVALVASSVAIGLNGKVKNVTETNANPVTGSVAAEPNAGAAATASRKVRTSSNSAAAKAKLGESS